MNIESCIICESPFAMHNRTRIRFSAERFRFTKNSFILVDAGQLRSSNLLSSRLVPYRSYDRDALIFRRNDGRPIRRRPGNRSVNTRLSLRDRNNLLTSNAKSIATGAIRIHTLGQGRWHVRGATKKRFLLNTARRTSSLNRRPHRE